MKRLGKTVETQMRGVFIFYVLFFIEGSQKEDIEDEVLKLNLEL